KHDVGACGLASSLGKVFDGKQDEVSADLDGNPDQARISRLEKLFGVERAFVHVRGSVHETDGDPMLLEEGLYLIYCKNTIVKDGGREHGIRFPLGEAFEQMFERSDAARSDDGEGRNFGNGAGERKIVAAPRSVFIHAGEEDLPSTP